MPVAEQDRIEVGVLGLEAVHEWAHGLVIPGFLAGPLRLNDEKAWPRWRVREIGGLGSGAERSGDSDPQVGRIGNTGRPSKIAGKTVTYSGTVFGRTLAEVRQARAAGIAAFSVQTLRPMRVIPHADYAGGTEHTYTATPMVVDIDEKQSSGPTRQPSGFAREFVIGLRLDDPRTYRPERTAAPDAAGIATIVNSTAPTDVLLELSAIAGDVTLTGTFGSVTLQALPAVCTVHLPSGTALDANGVAVGKVAAGSTLLDGPAAVPAGTSTLKVVGAQMLVRYRPAFW